MGELDFRKKRKNTNIRGTARKQGKNSRQRDLKTKKERNGLPVNAGEKIKKIQKGSFCGQWNFCSYV